MAKYKHVPTGKIIEIGGSSSVSMQTLLGGLPLSDIIKGKDWEELKSFEILSFTSEDFKSISTFRLGYHIFTNQFKNMSFTTDEWMKNCSKHVCIYSVRRDSDNSIFSLKQKLHGGYTIEEINYKFGRIYFNCSSFGVTNFLHAIELENAVIQVSSTPLKMEDGILIDTIKGWWYVIDGMLEKGPRFTNTMEYRGKLQTPEDKIKRFCKEENAKKYIEVNLPLMLSVEKLPIFKNDKVWVVYKHANDCSKKPIETIVNIYFDIKQSSILVFKLYDNALNYVINNRLTLNYKKVVKLLSKHNLNNAFMEQLKEEINNLVQKELK